MSKDYKKAGVDTGAADDWVSRILSSTQRVSPEHLKKNLVTGVGDYAAVYALNDKNWVAASCDGVGTKLLWHEAGMGNARDLAQDLLAMNVNDVLCVGARPTLFLDYLAIGAKELLQSGGFLENFIGGLAGCCAETGQLLIGGETAQMPEIYDANEFDLAGFSIGFMAPEDLLSVQKIRPGAEVWGWASSGPHSNGYSWLRKIFDSEKDAAFIKKHLMPATRLYVNEFFALREGLVQKGHKGALQAAFHITGSGLLNFLRAQPEGRSIGFDFEKWPTPPAWIEEVKKRTNASWTDLYSTFNMGIGFAVVLDAGIGEKAGPWLNSMQLQYLGKLIDKPVVRVAGLELT